MDIAMMNFDTHPVVATRESMFKRRFAQMDNDTRELLELFSAHCAEANDYARYGNVSEDVLSMLRARGGDDDANARRLNAAFTSLNTLGMLAANRGRANYWGEAGVDSEAVVPARA